MITGVNNNGYEYGQNHDGIGTTLSFARDDDGRVIIQATDAVSAEIGGVGTISGTAEIKFTVTDQDDVTAFEYRHEGDSDNNLELANVDGNHYNIIGENASVTAESGNADRTIQVDANNSTVDLSNTGGSNYVYMSEISYDNKTYLGYGNNNYIDAGKFNYVKAKGGSNRFETTSNAHGSVIVGGAGNDTFVISGKYGVIDGGAGNDTFEALGMFGENEEASYRNVIIGGAGDDTMTDKGGYNIYFGGTGTDTYETYGQSGIAYLGDNEESGGIIGSSADKSYIFSTTSLKSSSGRTYSLYDIMNRYNWTLNEFLNVYSQISGLNKESLGNHGVIDSETMGKLQEYFANNLSKSR